MDKETIKQIIKTFDEADVHGSLMKEVDKRPEIDRESAEIGAKTTEKLYHVMLKMLLVLAEEMKDE